MPKKPVQEEQVSVYKADTAKRRTALFFTIIGVAAVLLVVVIVNLPTRTAPPVTAPVETNLIHNKSEVIEYKDAENRLMYKDEEGRPHEFPLSSTVIITKGEGNPVPGSTVDLTSQAQVHIVVEKGEITRIHVAGD